MKSTEISHNVSADGALQRKEKRKMNHTKVWSLTNLVECMCVCFLLLLVFFPIFISIIRFHYNFRLLFIISNKRRKKILCTWEDLNMWKYVYIAYEMHTSKQCFRQLSISNEYNVFIRYTRHAQTHAKKSVNRVRIIDEENKWNENHR